MADSLKYKYLKQRNPQYRDNYWARCRAFYKGGEYLLNSSITRHVFPKHQNEDELIYDLRRRVSHYVNYSGEVIDHLVAKLMSDPIRISGEPELDGFYKCFLEDCTPPSGQVTDINTFLRDVVLTAMQCKTSWVLVDLPSVDQDNIQSLAEQETIGALDAWCVEIQPESVVDWEEDSAGELEWAMLCFKSMKRDGITGSRDQVTEKYVAYTRSDWSVWEVKYKQGGEPDDEDVIPLVNYGKHSFGHVPIIRLELPEGLWAMGKLESIAREHFCKRNALAWAEYKALLPVLYEFHNNDPILQSYGGDSTHEDRAYIQPRAVNAVQVRDEKDRVEWVAPDKGPFEHSLTSINNLRDEMHRVVHQMAQAADNKGALLTRSGESKKIDGQATNIILESLGKICRDFAKHLMKMIQYGRGDHNIEWQVEGMTDFTTESIADVIEMEAVLDVSVQIPSPTFKKIRKSQVANRILGDSVSEKDRDKIEKELETYFSTEGELSSHSLEEALRGPITPQDDEG